MSLEDEVFSFLVSISYSFSEEPDFTVTSGGEKIGTVGIGVKIKWFLFMDSIYFNDFNCDVSNLIYGYKYNISLQLSLFFPSHLHQNSLPQRNGCCNASYADTRKLGSIFNVDYRKFKNYLSQVLTRAFKLVGFGIKIWKFDPYSQKIKFYLLK